MKCGTKSWIVQLREDIVDTLLGPRILSSAVAREYNSYMLGGEGALSTAGDAGGVSLTSGSRTWWM